MLFPTSNIELPNTNKADEEEGFGKHGLEKPKDDIFISLMVDTSMKKKPKWWVCMSKSGVKL